MMDKIINRIIATLIEADIPSELVENVKNKMVIILNDYTISPKEQELVSDISLDNKAIQMFFVAKKVEGLADSSIKYYQTILKNFYKKITLPLKEIKIDTIRYYIAIRMNDGVSKTTLDNELRVLKSFFGWLSTEGYIDKAPTAGIKSIKKEKLIKKSFSEKDLEKIRHTIITKYKGVASQRALAIIDFLYSTGSRVSEVIKMNVDDVRSNECIVRGKGSKERVVYLNTRAQMSILEYIKARNDDNPALFVTLQKPYSRLTKGSVERLIKKVGELAGVANCHPHRFRRTTATIALNRGMPLEEVQLLLGHEKIETTTIYARSEQENVKNSHRKYVV